MRDGRIVSDECHAAAAPPHEITSISQNSQAGVIFSLTLPALTGWPAPLSISAILGGFAARLNPIEALRYE